MRRVCAFRGAAVSERSARVSFAFIRGLDRAIGYRNARLVIMGGEYGGEAPLRDSCCTQRAVEGGYIVTTNHSGGVERGCQA